MKKNDNQVVKNEAGLSLDIDKGAAGRRYRNFGCVVYPESAPENWIDILSDQKLPCFVSPLHDEDLDIQGQPKKPHYHVMVMFEGKKSRDQVNVIFNQIGGVGCEIVNSIRGYARYLCHMDNPEKHQYNPDDVICFGGADYFGICSLAVDKYKAIGEMMDFCKLEGIHSFAYFCRYAKDFRFDWFRILCDSGAFVMREYLKTLTWEDNENYDPDGVQV